MKKARFIYIFLIVSLTSAPVFAIQGSPIACPMTITCSYDTGVCDTPNGWVLGSGSAQEPFAGSQTMNLSGILAYKAGSPPNEVYQFTCAYKYGEYSAVSIYTYVKKLTGVNWNFSGFGSNKADCSSICDPNTCVGEK